MAGSAVNLSGKFPESLSFAVLAAAVTASGERGSRSSCLGIGLQAAQEDSPECVARGEGGIGLAESLVVQIDLCAPVGSVGEGERCCGSGRRAGSLGALPADT
jgi:hypothetical protein